VSFAGRIRAGSVLNGLLLVVLVIVSIYPTFWLLSISLQPTASAFELPPEFIFTPDLGNYDELLGNADFRSSLYYSVVIAVFATAVCLFAGAPAGFALSRFRLRGRNAVTVGMLLTRLAPSFAIVIPTFYLFDKLSLLETVPGLVLAMSAFHLPIAVLIMYGVCNGIPVALDEAARLEGASFRQVLQHVVLPVAWPGLAAAAVVTFALVWNEFLFVLVLAGTDIQTLPVTIATFETQRQILWGLIAAASIISTIPMLAVVVFAQRALLSGIGAGAVRG
jgi:multiple sugar transport system permease protein